MDLKSLQSLLNEGNVLHAKAKRSVMCIKGPDAHNFLQRMSTNDLRLLSIEQPLLTSFLSNKGKLVDAALVFLKADNELLLVSSFEDSSKLCLWLESFHFVEDFTLEEEKGLTAYYALSLNAPFSPKSLKLGSITVSKGLNAVLSCTLSEEPLEERLSADDVKMLALAAHIPTSPGEISEAFMPQNVGLLGTLSETKGCYIGQEVIAKALTYQKNTKRLVAFSLNREDFDQAKPGMKLRDREGRSGIITSLAPYYQEPMVQGLAVVDDKISSADTQENQLLAQFIF